MKAEECIPLEILQMLSKKWALLIPSLLYPNHKLRYSELASKLQGISPKTLTERLRELEKRDIIRRESFAEIPPRVEYSLTERGRELAVSLKDVLKWAEKWYPSNSHQ
jgi:DNA-binding HxlR family transcriptional regulator